MPAPRTETNTTSTSASTGTGQSSQAPKLTLKQQGRGPVTNEETRSSATASTDQPFSPPRRTSSQTSPTHYIILDDGNEIGIKEGTVELTIERKGRNCTLKEKTRAREEGTYQLRVKTLYGRLSVLPGGEMYSSQEDTSKKDASTKDVSKQDTVVTCKLGETGKWTWSEQWSEK
jgi:hypothetical protein